jgi:hypothetical protein
MEPACSSPYTQEYNTEPCSKPDESSPRPRNFHLKSCQPFTFSTNIYMYFSTFHAIYIDVYIWIISSKFMVKQFNSL